VGAIPMKFSVQHLRAFLGNDITVGAEAEDHELIARVTITLDGFQLCDDQVDPPSVSYERQLPQAGDGGPHMQHRLTITVTDPEGNMKSADRRWQDMT
jgi:hypothetical protein